MSDIFRYMQYDANKKSAAIAYRLWLLGGLLGVHRFYLEEKRTGVALLAITLISGVLMAVLPDPKYAVTIYIAAAWWFFDLFFLGEKVRSYNADLVTRIEMNSDN